MSWASARPTSAIMNDEAIRDIEKKIDREKGLLQGALDMSKKTSNKDVLSKLESQIIAARRNLQFYTETLNKVKERRVGQGMENMSLGHHSSASTSSMRPRSADLRNTQEAPPTPPPKDAGSNWSETSTVHSQNFAGGVGGAYGSDALQSPTYGDSTPAIKVRPNFTKLGEPLFPAACIMPVLVTNLRALQT